MSAAEVATSVLVGSAVLAALIGVCWLAGIPVKRAIADYDAPQVAIGLATLLALSLVLLILFALGRAVLEVGR